MEVRCGGACSHYFPYSPIFDSFYQLMTVEHHPAHIMVCAEPATPYSDTVGQAAHRQ